MSPAEHAQVRLLTQTPQRLFSYSALMGAPVAIEVDPIPDQAMGLLQRFEAVPIHALLHSHGDHPLDQAARRRSHRMGSDCEQARSKWCRGGARRGKQWTSGSSPAAKERRQSGGLLVASASIVRSSVQITWCSGIALQG